MEKPTLFEKYMIRFICLSLAWFFIYSLLSLLFCACCTSRPIEYENFEKETWLNIEQLSEKYHVDKSQILEQYNEMKLEQQNNNQQTLEEEIFNALNKHQ